jgi:HK97 family phage portal protein
VSVLDWFTAPSIAEEILDAGENWWWTDGTKSLASKQKVTEKTALNYSAVWAATRAIAETLASLPAVVYEQLDEPRVRQRASGSSLYRLLHDQPNPEMDAFTFYEMQTARLVNAGNAFAEIERNEDGEPVALWPIHKSRVKAWRLPDEQLPNGRFKAGELEYHVQADSGGYYVIPAADMLNVVGTHSTDGIWAPGVIAHAAESIGLGLATEKYGASFFGSGARPPGVLEHPGSIKDPKIRSQIRKEWNELHQGEGNWHNVAVLWEGMKYKDIGVPPEQAQFLGTRQFNTRVIAQWYGVSPAILQDYADSKFQTVEAELKHFIMLAVRPWAVRWERAIQRQVIGLESRFLLEFLMNALLRGDPKTQAETNKIKFMHGALSDDEWRAQDNENPLPDGQGQHYYVPLNLARVEDVINGNTLRAKTSSGEKPENRDQKQNADLKTFREKMLKRCQAVIDERAGRMFHTEVQAVAKAAENPAEFLAAITAFYGRFEGKLCEAITPGVISYMEALGVDEATSRAFASAAARNHVEESKRFLLAAAECQPAELAGRVALVQMDWAEWKIDLEQLRKAG